MLLRLCLSLAFSLPWFASCPKGGLSAWSEDAERTPPSPARPFAVGERLTYSVEWGFIKAGTASLTIEGIEAVGGRDCYRIVSLANSSPTFSVFFKVEDRVVSYTDTVDLSTCRYEKHLQEGRFRANQVVDFDQEAGKAIYPDGREYPLSPQARDALATLYYVRSLKLEVGKSVYVDNHTDRVNYPLEVKVLRRERVKVGAGAFDCLVVEPVLKYSGIFENKGKLTVWVTDDQRRIPVLMRSKILIGAISAVLEEVGTVG
jgi:hypothetical protein